MLTVVISAGTLLNVLLVEVNALSFLGKLTVDFPERDTLQAVWEGDGQRTSATALLCGTTVSNVPTAGPALVPPPPNRSFSGSQPWCSRLAPLSLCRCEKGAGSTQDGCWGGVNFWGANHCERPSLGCRQSDKENVALCCVSEIRDMAGHAHVFNDLTQRKSLGYKDAALEF